MTPGQRMAHAASQVMGLHDLRRASCWLLAAHRQGKELSNLLF